MLNVMIMRAKELWNRPRVSLNKCGKFYSFSSHLRRINVHSVKPCWGKAEVRLNGREMMLLTATYRVMILLYALAILD